MASIYPNMKDGKIVSFKFKTLLERDENGKQITRCITWKPNKPMTESKLKSQAEKESILWEKKVKEEYLIQKGAFVPCDITFESFVTYKWMPNQLENVRPSTYAFRSYLLKVIIPYLGSMQIGDITNVTIEKYLDYLKNTYKTANGNTVSQQTMKHHYSTLNLIFTYAVKLGYISDNPLLKVDSPKLSKHKVDALSKGEVMTFIREVENLPLMQRLMYMLLLTTGVRRGELFGLKWKDIDLDTSTIKVERNIVYTSFAGICEGLPKTDMSIREIPLTDGVVNLITEYKAEENPLSYDAYLFHSAKSQTVPHDPTYLTKHMKRLMKRIGLPDMSPHDLRHTCASMLLQSGADIKSVQDILGHTDASTTLNFYVKSNMENMRGATQRAFGM